MLVIARKYGEAIHIQAPDGPVVVTVVKQKRRSGVTLGIAAPKAVSIERDELLSSDQLAEVLKRARAGRNPQGEAGDVGSTE